MAVGETLVDPLTGCEPTPLSMSTVVAFVVVQVRVELFPAVMVEGRR